MKILLSPAKKIDETTDFPNIHYENPLFSKQTEELVKTMKTWKISDFKTNMKISDDLAELNYQRFQDWVSPHQESAVRKPAIFSFNGEAYRGFDIHSLSEDFYPAMNEKLILLSGLYGILRPLDWMYPYRLEMGTKANFNQHKNLYEFWGDTLINYLNEHEKEVIFNLASSEYFKAAKLNQAIAKVITPVFKDEKNGQLKTVMMYAKHQRGKFSRFLIENETENSNDYQSYSEDRYLFSKELSTEKEWVFVR